MIFLENPIVVTENETFFDTVVSPPDKFNLYFFCSFDKEFMIKIRFFLVKLFLLPNQDF